MSNMVMGLRLHHKHYTFVKCFSLKTIWILKVFAVVYFWIFTLCVCMCLEVRTAGERVLLPHGSLGLKWEHQALGEVLLSVDSSYHPSPLKRIHSIFMYLRVVCACICAHMYEGAWKGQKAAWIPWNWSCRQLWMTQCGSGEWSLGPPQDQPAC